MPLKNKDPFANVPQEFKEMVDAQDRDTIKTTICQITLNQLELMEAQKDDEDYQNLKEQFREAGAVYREGTKSNALKIKYAKQVLEAKGG